jgi:hypothetical protein
VQLDEFLDWPWLSGPARANSSDLPPANRLDLSNADWGGDGFTSVNRDQAGIYLCHGDQGRGGAWIWIGVEDAEKLHDELKARGVTIRMPLTNHPWALEFQVEDPDGNVIRFGSEPK